MEDNMKVIGMCAVCKSEEVDYLERETCYCFKCGKVRDYSQRFIETPQERLKRQVYATGNKWAIENWKATHE